MAKVALDFQFDETTDGRRLNSPQVVHEYTHEALAVGRVRVHLR